MSQSTVPNEYSSTILLRLLMVSLTNFASISIPCMYVSSICGKDDYCAHAFNAVYIKDDVNGRQGWTLVDPTWASPNGSDGNNPNASKTLSGATKFAKGCFNIFKRKWNSINKK